MRITNLSTVNFLRFFFYLPIIFVDYRINIDNILRWHPLFSDYFYLPVPDILFAYPVYVFAKYFFFFSCLMCALNVLNKAFSIFAALFGFIFYLVMYSVGVSDHQYQLVVHILFLFGIYENCKSLTDKQFIFLGQVCLAIVFCSAGITKIKKLGYVWVSEDAPLQFLLYLRLAFSSYAFNLEDGKINLFLIRNYNSVKYFFYAVPLLELIAPLMLFKRFFYLYLFYIVLQIGIYLSMGISFAQFAGAYSFFLVPSILLLIYRFFPEGSYLKHASDKIRNNYIK